VLATLPEIKKVEKEKKVALTSATLVVVPPALISQWISEVVKVAGDNLVVDVFDHNSLEFDRRSNHPVDDFDADIVLTTYQTLEKGKKGHNNASANILLSMHWARVVLDECKRFALTPHRYQRTAMM
jgi:SNF2 family DNA or RNA helicase